MSAVSFIRLSLGGVVLVFATVLWDASSGLRLLCLRSSQAILHNEVSALQQEVMHLRQEVVLLQQEGRSEASLDYLLHIAREEAGFVAGHEQVLLFSNNSLEDPVH